MLVLSSIAKGVMVFVGCIPQCRKAPGTCLWNTRHHGGGRINTTLVQEPHTRVCYRLPAKNALHDNSGVETVETIRRKRGRKPPPARQSTGIRTLK